MALYVPRAFAVDDRRALNQLIDEHPFATLVTPATPEPFVSHELLPDAADAERVIGALVARFEGRGESAWAFAMQGRPRDALVANVTAFRIVIERVTGKFKLSQNRAPVDRRRVIEALTAVDHAEAQATAAWMRRFADPDA